MKFAMPFNKVPNPIPLWEERLGTLSLPRKALLYVLTFVLMGGGFYYFLYQPKADKIVKLRATVVKEEQRLVTLKRIAVEVEPFEQEVAKARDKLEELMTLLPDRKEIPDLLEKISAVGAQEGLENLLFQPQGEKKFEFYAAIPVRLDVVGSYHRIGVFLDKLSKLDRIIQVENLSMSREKGNDLKVNCTLNTYRFLEESERPKKEPQKKK